MQLTLNNATPNQMEAVMEILGQVKTARQVGCYEGEDVNSWEFDWGYNERSGNVYCAISNGVTIAAPDFRPSQISFYVHDEEGEEEEFDTYEEAYKEAMK